MTAIDVGDLLDQPGSSRRVSVSEELEGLETELARVPAERPVLTEVLLESIAGGISVSGSVAGRMELTCARCLKGFARGFRLEVAERYTRDEDDEDYPLGERDVDLEPMVRDAILLAMPFSPLCGPNCQGLCERCGEDRNLGDCSCPPRADPRWAALEDLRLD